MQCYLVRHPGLAFLASRDSSPVLLLRIRIDRIKIDLAGCE